MDNLGDLFGGLGDVLGEMFGGEAGAEGAMGIAELFSPESRRGEAQAFVYERYLCGGPRKLHVNDR
jgi:hypothetical protein